MEVIHENSWTGAGSRPGRGRYGAAARLSMLGAGLLFLSCAQDSATTEYQSAQAVGEQDLRILSITEISGTVNDSAVRGRIEATIDTSRGGVSTCQFPSLPKGFTPGTFGTHT
ncbi:hypothetical protein [Haliangium sp.]|uniref:hypothetical protein n=1 Tax=Haliangium sp. TaxID=2663208 RepID=UPI003D0E6E65